MNGDAFDALEHEVVLGADAEALLLEATAAAEAAENDPPAPNTVRHRCSSCVYLHVACHRPTALCE